MIFLKATSCDSPQEGYNTIAVNTTEVFAFHDIYTYTCLDGYETDEPLTVVCLTNGTWSSHPPECTGENICLMLVVHFDKEVI